MTEKKSSTNRLISVIIPNYNGSSTIGECLAAVFSSDYDNFEVIVVDDCSTDNSVEIIKRFPCRLITFDKNSGASRARNAGASEASGEIFFLIDSDCIVQKDTLSRVSEAFAKNGDKVIGGTYTKIPYDDSFFSTFQSIFINYSETKREEPDYIAAHAMVINPVLFFKSGGFPEDFLPIIEDVEFSHRIRRSGFQLLMEPSILVRHIFNYTLVKSLKNGFRKSKYWTVYSMTNRDMFKDSGTASSELKTNIVSFFITLLLLVAFLPTGNFFAVIFSALIQSVNIFIINKRLLREFLETKGLLFAFSAAAYYVGVYPLAVGTGAVAGVTEYCLKYRKQRF